MADRLLTDLILAELRSTYGAGTDWESKVARGGGLHGTGGSGRSRGKPGYPVPSKIEDEEPVVPEGTEDDKKKKSLADLKSFLREAVPALVLTNIVHARSLKACSGISPSFTEVAADRGFDAFTYHLPGHVVNVVDTRDGVYEVDLSAIQFEFCPQPDDEGDAAELKRLLGKVVRNPFAAAKVKKLAGMPGSVEGPTGRRDKFWDPVAAYDRAVKRMAQMKAGTAGFYDLFGDEGYMSEPDPSGIEKVEGCMSEAGLFGLFNKKAPKKPGSEDGAEVGTLQAQGILKQFAKLLKDKKGIDAAKLAPIKEGTKGTAFAVDAGRVLKVTPDKKEAVAARRLQERGGNLERLVKVYDVWRFPAQTGGKTVYGVLQERLEPLSAQESKYVNDSLVTTGLPLWLMRAGHDWKAAKEMVVDHVKNPRYMRQNMARVGATDEESYFEQMNDRWNFLSYEVGMKKMHEELLALGIKFQDYHAGNFMKRSDGSYVLIDPGLSEVAGGTEPPVLEKMVLEAVLGEVSSSGEGDRFGIDDEIGEALLKANAELLKEKKGIDVSNAKALGVGTQGIAFDVGSGRVLKITADKHEALASFQVSKRPLDGIVRIYDVWRFKGKTPDVYGMGMTTKAYGILEEKLLPLAREDAQYLEDALTAFDWPSALRQSGYDFDRAKAWTELYARVHMQRTLQIFGVDREDYEDEFQMRWRFLIEDIGLDQMAKSLSSVGIRFSDYHAGNIMVRPNEGPVLIDLGFSQGATAGEPPVLESMVLEAAIRELGDMTDYGPVDVAAKHGKGQDGTEADRERFFHGDDESRVEEARKADEVAVVPLKAQPPTKAHGALLRKLAKANTKVVVFLNEPAEPLSYEVRVRALELQLPDVWSKLEVHRLEFGSSPSSYLPGALSDLVREGGSSVKEGVAVTVLVPADEVAGAKTQAERARQHLASGEEGAFDPELMVVEALPSDPDADPAGKALLAAAEEGDVGTASGLVDAHLASNEEGLREFLAAVAGEEGKKEMKAESLVTELLADIGRQGIEKVLDFNAKLLADAKQIYVDKLAYIDQGTEGVAYDMGGGRVLKVTTDEREARSSFVLVGKTLEHVVRVHDVFRFGRMPQGMQGHRVFAVVQEKLTPLSETEKDEFDRQMEEFDPAKIETPQGRKVYEGDFEGSLQAYASWLRNQAAPTGSVAVGAKTAPAKKGAEATAAKPADERQVQALVKQKREFLKRYNVDRMMGELRSLGIGFADYHAGNVMKRGTSYVITDIGRSKSQGGEPPVLERVVEAVLAEIGITGPDAGSWGASAATGPKTGTSPWSQHNGPYRKDHIPEDEEDEGQRGTLHRQDPNRGPKPGG